LIEAPVYVFLLAALVDVPVSKAAACSVTVNLISHPVFVFALVPAAATVTSPVPAVLIGELVVWGIESALVGLWLRRDLPSIVAVCLLANSTSFLAGLLIL
jgi:hypothetical protein